MDNKILDELKKPFHPGAITWKPGTVTKDQSKALAFAYADPRAYMERLDEVLGWGWDVTYTPWGDRIVCHVTINGVTRSSSGEPDSQSERSEIAGTSAEAQAFKRACAMFGLGRYLYALPSVWVEFDASSKQFTDKGKAKLEGIIVQHYRRTMGKPEDNDTAVLPVVSHRNTVAIAAHEDIDRTLEEIDKGIDEEPARNPDAEWEGIQGALDKKRVSPTKNKGNTFQWPSLDDADAMGLATNLLHFEGVTVNPFAYDLIAKYHSLHTESRGKCLSTGQVKYIDSLIDKVTGEGSSHAVLSALCGFYEALPGWKVKVLIDDIKAKDEATLEGLNGVATAIKEALKETA